MIDARKQWKAIKQHDVRQAGLADFYAAVQNLRRADAIALKIYTDSQLNSLLCNRVEIRE